MADSIGERIMQAVVAALTDAVDAPAKTYRGRVNPFTERELPAFAVCTVDESADFAGRTQLACVRTIKVEAHVAGKQNEQQLDPLVVFAIKTLYASQDLGALVTGLKRPRIRWGSEPMYDDAAVAVIEFEAEFKTKADDPTEQIL